MFVRWCVVINLIGFNWSFYEQFCWETRDELILEILMGKSKQNCGNVDGL
jgi:hypothetical protein